MLETIVCIILAPVAIVAFGFSIALLGGLFNYFKTLKK
jgi:hypothetical protein